MRRACGYLIPVSAILVAAAVGVAGRILWEQPRAESEPTIPVEERDVIEVIVEKLVEELVQEGDIVAPELVDDVVRSHLELIKTQYALEMRRQHESLVELKELLEHTLTHEELVELANDRPESLYECCFVPIQSQGTEFTIVVNMAEWDFPKSPDGFGPQSHLKSYIRSVLTAAAGSAMGEQRPRSSGK